MSFIKKLAILTLIIFPIAVFATEILPNPQSKASIVSAFKYYKNVSPNITKTTVIEVPFNQDSFSIPVFAVYNLTTSSFEPNLLFVNSLEIKANLSASGAVNSPSLMNDGNYSTFTEFPLTANSNTTDILFNFKKPITASSLSFALDNYVALPHMVSISARDTNSQSMIYGKDFNVVLAPVRPSSGNVVFPQTTSAVWSVVFNYVQPLRISEIKFNDVSGGGITTRGLRFLAQPGQSYQIYFDADRYVKSAIGEAGDLSSNKGVVSLGATASIANPQYVPVDSDGDEVPDLTDNCVSVFNADQVDADGNGLGDACEDYDRDRILNANDNCPDVPNVAQTDTDKDGMGDICDNLDNRVTERMPWLPWVGIGIAFVVVLGLFVIVFRHKKETTEEDISGDIN